MPEDEITPFDSYARRLEGKTKEAAEEKAKTDAERAAEPKTPFDSYTGRLDEQLHKTVGEPQVEGESEALEPDDEIEAHDDDLEDDETDDESEAEGDDEDLEIDNADDDEREVEADPTVAPLGPGPLGSGEYVVKQGDCISSIAEETGHFWETIWDDPTNAELREVRRNPNVLLPGDLVTVPAMRQKQEPGQTEMRHRFVRKGQPEVFRVRILRDDQPRGNEPYTLDVDGTIHEGVTDADGNVQVPIEPEALRAKLTIGSGDDVEEHLFELGELDPITELSGVQGRLRALGFDCGPATGQLNPSTKRVLKKYQSMRKLRVTGEPDEATREKLESEYGC